MSRQQRARMSAPAEPAADFVRAQLASGYIQRAEWLEPIDTSGMSAEQARIATTRGARLVKGFRRADPLILIYGAQPAGRDRRQIQAAAQLRADDEVMQSGGMDCLVRLQGVPSGYSTGGGAPLAKLMAIKARRDAEAHCGRLWDVIAAVVLAHWTLARWARFVAKSPHAARERLAIGLDMLADYYGLGKDGA